MKRRLWFKIFGVIVKRLRKKKGQFVVLNLLVRAERTACWLEQKGQLVLFYT